MQRHELETILFKLDECYAVYQKKLDAKAGRVWERIFSGHDFDICEKALEEWVLKNDRAPKPSNIEELIARIKPREQGDKNFYAGDCPQTRKALKQEREGQKIASAEVNTAFLILHKLQFSGDGAGIIPPQVFENRVDMTRERALEIVNEICARENMPDAIDDRFKIESYWRK